LSANQIPNGKSGGTCDMYFAHRWHLISHLGRGCREVSYIVSFIGPDAI
jgi:hypothetical protein